MPSTPSATNVSGDSPREVERIRDILFGTQMRDYAQQFDLVTRDLERLRQAIDQLNEQLAAHDAEQTKKLQALKRDVRQADEELRAEQRLSAEQLRHDKADRQVLAELFIQLGNQLKDGASVSDLLEQLTRTSNNSNEHA